MTVKLQTSFGVAKGVTIECSPVEYMVIISALRGLADTSPKDIETAEQMLAQAKAVYEEA